ncbi:ATP-binding protein [Kribbella sp. NPDC026611]|uniref:ATP-binding protein n=1 Tax=Kribbella sp. NPDC026611 TaxID=3154911 RepID=UPI0033EE4FA7
MSRPQLDIDVSSRSGATIVGLTGILDVATAPRLRDALLKCIADQPTAVIADLTLMELRKAYTLTVFAVVARRTAEWSGVPLILVARPGDGSRLDLHTKAIARFLPVYPDLAAAVASIHRPPTRRITRLRLAATPHSALTARRVVVATCELWNCIELADDAAAVVSELVANVVLHAGTDSVLRLELRRGLLTVAVSDGSPLQPRWPTPSVGGDEVRPGGFGLRIIESLSTTWGWGPTSDGGKVVWAVLRLPTGVQHPVGRIGPLG